MNRSAPAEGKPKPHIAATSQWDKKAGVAKYDPLYHHLRRKGLSELEMSFADIEHVIKALLPKSAKRPQWWANEASEETTHVQCRAWRAAGYDAYLIERQERVRFRRR
jgi:hypothetical protein